MDRPILIPSEREYFWSCRQRFSRVVETHQELENGRLIPRRYVLQLTLRAESREAKENATAAKFDGSQND